jgi:hypothetical protein
MYRIIQNGRVVDIGQCGMGSSIQLEDGTIIQLWIGSMDERPENLMVEGVDYPIGTPTKCQHCNKNLPMAPLSYHYRDIRSFVFLDGTIERIASCMNEECHTKFMNRARALSRDPNVRHD